MRAARRILLKAVVVACSLVVATYTVLYQMKINVHYIESSDAASSSRSVSPRNTVVSRRPYDVMVNSYMRSGSSFTGQLLAFRPDTFYWYEPLWNYNSAVYYMGPDKMCIHTSTCVHQNAISGQTRRMQGVLANIYACNFTGLQPAVADQMTYLPVYAGESWAPYRNCKANQTSGTNCLELMEDVCRRAKHRATKVLRMTVDNLDSVLQQRRNLKIIHLLRDPRAIINSRIATTWYSLKDVKLGGTFSIRRDADDLCKRMTYDLNASVHLKNKYPDRFALIMFEDLQANLFLKARLLYEYFGIDHKDLAAKLASMPGILQNEHTVNANNFSRDYSQWWRHQLSFPAIDIVQQTCGGIMTTLGYRQFISPSETADSSVKSYNFNSSLLIENLKLRLPYKIT